MAGVTNIQELFRRISANNVKTYMTHRGWRICPSDPAVLQFEGPFGDNGEPVQQWIWASEQHPKFRNRIPNLIFALNVLEKRESLEIANEVADSLEAAIPTPAAGPHRLRFRNQQPEPLTVWTRDRRPLIQLQSGEGIEAEAVSEMSLDERGLVLNGDSPARLLRYLPAVASREQANATGILGNDSLVQPWLSELTPLLTRVDFEMSEQKLTDEAGQNWLRRQTALIAASLAPRLPETAAEPLWRLCGRLLSLAELHLEITDNSAAGLFRVAAEDNAVAPRKTLDWLLRHARY